MSAQPTPLADTFRQYHRLLWGVCYRMTGSAADADDLVQDTFARALERPPEGQVRPWLVKVALNLGRDHLRRRRRRGYSGPWLPTPVALGPDGLAPADAAIAPEPGPSARYELRESASFAFLVALETMTPRERAVLLLRDVLDYSVREAAEALAMSEANVKTTHHRARRRMSDYDAARDPVPASRTLEVLQTFLTHLVAQDAGAIEALLSADVRALSDGGDEFFAAKVPLVGRDKVARFYLKITRLRPQAVPRFRICELNGTPAFLVEFDDVRPGEAPRVVLLLDLDAAGSIRSIYSVLASEKVAGLF